MATFHGTLRLATEPDAVHSATVILVDGRFVLRAAGSEIGDWPLQDLNFSYAGEEIRVRIDGDEALLSMPERGAFAAAVGLAESGVDTDAPAAPPAEITTEPGTPPEPGAAPEEPAGAADQETAEPEPFAVNLDPTPPPGPTTLSDAATPAASAVATPFDSTEAEPAPTADFSVGLGGDQWATNDPPAAAPEPPFAVGEIGSPPPSPDETSAPEHGMGALSDSAPSADVPPPDDDTPPWVPTADSSVAMDDLASGTPVFAQADDGAEPGTTPEDLDQPAADVDEPATEAPVSGVPLSSDEAPASTTDAAVSNAATDVPRVDESDTNDLPVEAAGAAAAVWDVRNRPPAEDAAVLGQSAPGGAPDDLVAARLAAQRDSTLGSAAAVESHDAAPEADPAATPPDATTTGEETEQAPLDDRPGDAGGSALPQAGPAAPADEADDGLDRLREQSTAGYEDSENLRKWVAWGLLIGGGLIGIGAFLTWGNTRMFDTDFPVARALAALAAVASVAGFILGFFMHRRTQGAYVAGTGAVLGLMTLIAYGRAAGLGVGFFLTLVGVLVVAGLSILAITPAGESRNKRNGR